MSYWITQALNGLAFAMLLFLLASGLSLIFGLMGIANLAHGSLYLLGGYMALTIIDATDNFALGFLGASLVGGLIGALLYWPLLRRFEREPLMQVLFTFGFLFATSNFALWVWGGSPQLLPKPAFLEGAIHLGERSFPTYRLFVIVLGLTVALCLWLLLERTKLGAIVRAGLDDPMMVKGIGIDISLVSTAVFALGSLLAASAGVIGAPFLSIYPGADLEILLFAFAVVVIGGLGTLEGALAGSVVVGLIDSFGKVLFPEFAMFTIFVPMAIILAIKPSGLLGRL